MLQHAAIPQPNTDEARETPQTRMARFLLRYNYAKAKTTSPSKMLWRQAEGVRFGSGRIALDMENGNGTGYGSFREMETALRKQGNFEVRWID